MPGLSGVEIKEPSDDLMPAAKTHALFSTIFDFYDGHIQDWLSNNGIELGEEAQKEIKHLLQTLEGELGKLTNSGERERLTVKLVGTKNVYDAFYDAIGENCAGQYGFALANRKFQPIRLIDPKTRDHIGVVYALKGSVDGVPALVLAGVQIRKKYAYSIKPMGKFIEQLIDKLNEVAIENKLTGGVWTTVGPANKNNSWTDDGRIGQLDLIRNGVIELGIARSGDNSFKELDESEQIQFPPEFNGAINRVIRLSATGEEVAPASPKLKWYQRIWGVFRK